VAGRGISGGGGGAIPIALALASLVLPVLEAAASDSLVLLAARSTGPKRVITHDEWAADLVEALGAAAALPETADSSERFALLCPDRVELATQAGGRRVPARSPLHAVIEPPPERDPGDPFRTTVTVPASALYVLAVEGVGAQRWVVDGRPLAHLDPSQLGVAYAPVIVPLRRGPHEITVTLGPGARVERAELSAYRPLCLAPGEGWHSGQALTAGAQARTLVQVLGLERQLPRDGAPIEIEGEAFAESSAWGERAQGRLSPPASGGGWVAAVGSPAEFSYRVRLDEPGTFSLSARVDGASPQLWSIDGRYRVTLRPGEVETGFRWLPVVSLSLAAGEHTIRLVLARGGRLDALRLVKRRSANADYVALLEDTGFAPSAPHRLVTRSAADERLSSPDFVRRLYGPTGARRLLGAFAGRKGDAPLARRSEPMPPIGPPFLSPDHPPGTGR
jgi:hypothetical protein